MRSATCCSPACCNAAEARSLSRGLARPGRRARVWQVSHRFEPDLLYLGNDGRKFDAMKPVAPSSLDAQLFGLGTLVQLLKRARRAATAEELGFVMVNETHALLPYRQAALWQRNAPGTGKVVAVSGAAVVERNAPFMLWLNPAFAKLDEGAESGGLRPVDAASLG